MKISNIKLDITLTDFCSLNCRFCCHGTPLFKDKKHISLEELERISKFFKPYEFHVIKISGGEPTLHPEFAKICDNLKRLFPAKSYYLATNGFLLEKYIENVKIFNIIELSNYPPFNDKVYNRLVSIKNKIPNLVVRKKEEYDEIIDVNREMNLDKKNIFRRCPYTDNVKIVQDRIYPCCNIFGQAMRQNIKLDKISVKIDENWRENLEKINIEPYCRQCFVDVPGPFEASVYKIVTKTGRWLKEKIKPLHKLSNYFRSEA